MLEGYTSLGFLAGQTSNVELGLLVTGVTYRHPGLLAKIVTTLDVLSGGRAMLGIGAAWYEREHAGLGVPFPSTSRALRAARGGAADLSADVERRRRPVRGQALPAGRDRLRPAAAPAAGGPPDPDRRQRRAQDPAPGRAVRRRLQPLRRRPGRGGAQDRGARRALRRPRAATRPRSSAPLIAGTTRSRTSTRSCAGWRRTPPSASTRSGSARPPTTPSGASPGSARTCSPDSGRSARDPARPADGPRHRGDGRARTRPRPSVRRPRHPRRRARTIHGPGSASW